MRSHHSSEELRDDFQKYINNVPKGSSVTAYINETFDGVRLRHKNEIYEIPRDHLQSALANQLFDIYKSCKGINQKIQQIKLREEDQTFVVADLENRAYPASFPHRLVKSLRNRIFGAQHDPDAFTWTWRERVQDRMDRFPESVAISKNDPEFSGSVVFAQRKLQGKGIITFYRPKNPDSLQINVGQGRRKNITGPNSRNLRKLRNIVATRLFRLEATLFPDDVKELLATKSEGEREFIQEKMLDAFEKPSEFESEMPTGISLKAVCLGATLAHGVVAPFSGGSIASKITKGAIGVLVPPAIAFISQASYEPEITGETQFGLAKRLSDIAKAKLLENCVVQTRKGTEAWKPCYAPYECNDGGTFKRDKTDRLFAIFSANNSDESVRLPVEMIPYKPAL